MGLGTPSYVSVASNGSTASGGAVSPWQLVDDFRNPVNISFVVISSSAAALNVGGAGLQFTLDDPTGMPAHPLSSPFQGNGYVSSNPFVTTFGASQIGVQGSSGLIPVTSASAFATLIGSVMVPIRAWRLTNPATTGTAICTALQAGPR